MAMRTTAPATCHSVLRTNVSVAELSMSINLNARRLLRKPYEHLPLRRNFIICIHRLPSFSLASKSSETKPSLEHTPDLQLWSAVIVHGFDVARILDIWLSPSDRRPDPTA